MLILFDQNVPVPIRQFLKGHTVKTAWEQNWDKLSNGHLLARAETAGFDLLITCDQGFAFQQSLKQRRIAIVLLRSGQWPYIKPAMAQIVEAVNAARPGSLTIVEIPVIRKP